MNKIKVFFTNKDNRPKVIAIIVAAAVLVVGGIVAAIVAFNVNQEQKTSISGAIDMFTTVDDVPPASVMIAPSSDKWWNSLLDYSSNRSLDKVKYDTISSGAKNIAYSVSKGSEYKSVSALGVSTTYVIYDTVENAQKAEKVMTSAGIQQYLHENVLVFIPEGAFSDIDYTLSALKDKETNLIKPMNISDAQWNIDFGNFKELYTANFVNPSDILTFEELMKTLGLGDNSGWSGASKDGLTWTGKFNNVSIASIPNAEEIVRVLTAPDAEQRKKMEELMKAGEPAPDGGEYSLPLAPKIQRMLPSCCLNVSNNDKSVGSYFWNNEEVKLEVLPKNEGILRITFLINDAAALISGETAAYPISNMGLMTVTVLDAKGNSKITFVKAPPIDASQVVTETVEVTE